MKQINKFRDLLCKCPYSARMRENAGHKNSNTDTFYTKIDAENNSILAETFRY